MLDTDETQRFRLLLAAILTNPEPDDGAETEDDSLSVANPLLVELRISASCQA